MTSRTLSVILLLLTVVTAQQTYQLVWREEFDGNKLDTSKWIYQVTCSPANDELQCYTNSEKNVQVSNGTLKIKTLIENGGNGKKYSSGRINTQGKAFWKYGRFEARAKLPNGLYLWPALWMMPNENVYGGWAASGEIDIMENRGGSNSEHSCALHYGGSWPKNTHTGSGSKYASADLTKDFHVYSVEWTPEKMVFMLDGNAFHTISLQRSFANGASNPYTKNGQPFDQNFYFLINDAVGGNFFGANSQSLTTAIAQKWANPVFEVDYVRAYQLKNGVVPNPVPAPIPTSSKATPATTRPNEAPATPSACSDMFQTLRCRTSSQDPSKVDAGRINSARDWLCGQDKGTYCTEIQAGGKYAGCNEAQKISFAMNKYYNVFRGSQGDGACSFGGLGSVQTTQDAPTPTTKTTTCPSTQSLCRDAFYGDTCIQTSGPFACVTGDDNKPHLCPRDTSACGRACYPPSLYKCTSGVLERR